MQTEIRPSVSAAGLEAAVRQAAEQLPIAISDPRPIAEWEVVRDAYGSNWVVLALSDGRGTTMREMFEPSELSDARHLRDRMAWLWDRVIRVRLEKGLQRLAEPWEPAESSA